MPPVLPVSQLYRLPLHHRKRRLVIPNGKPDCEEQDALSVSKDRPVIYDDSRSTSLECDGADSTDDEEMEVQAWRGERHLREMYLQSKEVWCKLLLYTKYITFCYVQVSDNDFLNTEEREFLSAVKDATRNCYSTYAPRCCNTFFNLCSNIRFSA